MIRMKLVLAVVLCLAPCTVPVNSENTKLKEIFAWKFVDYAWGKPEDRVAAIASGEFVPENNLPLGLEVWKDKLFITIPRWKNGVVSTLNYVKIIDEDDTTPLPPEPTENMDTAESEDNETPNDPTSLSPADPAPLSTIDPTTPPPPIDLTTLWTATDPTTSLLPTDPATSNPRTTEDPMAANKENPTPQLSASVLPMPARSLVIKQKRFLHVSGEDELQYNVLLRKSSEKEGKEKDNEKKKSDENKKKKKTEKNGKKKKKDNDKDKKDKDKKKNKKKCKPKPKPTTPAPPPPTPPTVAEATDATDATTGTETTASAPSPPRSPALIPYPSFAANRVILTAEKKEDEPAPIVSVFRVWADACDRLWVMDTGVADILGKTAVVSKPRILIYNLNNDELIKTYEFKDSDSEEHSFFANIVVDSNPENCDKAFAYVPDLGGYGIVSYDFATDKSRRIKHNYFHFDPLAGNMEVGGVNFQWTDGVFSIALSKPMEDGFRTAYFHCLASTKEFSVSTKVLKSQDDSENSYYDYKLLGDRGEKSQSSASYIHEDTGIMFYTQLQKDSVNCWNTNKPLAPENLVEIASDNETMIFTNDLKVDREGNLWVLTDKLPVFIYKGLDDTEVNYRIFTARVDEAVSDTNCAP